jgi:DNA-binding response OmpR family regulator
MTDPRVLVVDDDLEMIAFVQEILSLVPGEVLIAQSGEEGLSVLRQERQNKNVVDAMLLDVVMPGADGFRILQQMKSDLLLQQVPVILVTGVGEVHNKARGLQMGADDYITKPFDPQELLARINAVLRVRRSEQMLRGAMRNLPHSTN